MKLDEIKKKLNDSEYDFLRTNEHLGNNIILLTLGGSHAYGTNVENSDVDIRGIALERKQELIGLSNFEQFENHETDTTIYAFRKIIGLLLNCNPNVIEILGVEGSELLFILTEEGRLLRDNIDLFLSKKCIHSFGGYVTAQLKRLQNALARDNYPQTEKEKHILQSINATMRHIVNEFIDYNQYGNINLFVDKSLKEDMETEIYMDINLKKFPLRDFTSIYNSMHEVVKQYGKLNSRNKKKDTGHLLKHAMHLIRLLDMGTEILRGEGVYTLRPNKEFLLDIRNGKYSYDDIFQIVDEKEKIFKYASDNTSLPSKPNFKKIEELVIEINRRCI